jgi:sirohydrochlorin ferrochelatase
MRKQRPTAGILTLVLSSLLPSPILAAKAAPAAPATSSTAPGKIGYLVIAPDRGFMGNEETREAFEEYRAGFTASLAYVTREETRRFLAEGIAELERAKVKEIVAIPLFLSAHQPLYRKADSLLSGPEGKALTKLPLKVAAPLSGSYLLPEIVSDRIAALSKDPKREMLILVAQGSPSDSAGPLEKDLEHVIHQLHARYAFAASAALAVSGRGPDASQARLEKTLDEARSRKLTPVLVPCDLSMKLDGMMSFPASLAGLAKKKGAAYDGADLTPHPAIALHLAKQSNSNRPITSKELGVIFMPHGSSHGWNRAMLDAIAPLMSKYMIEPVFSMGDPPLIEKGVRKLEKRGARAVTVVRVFSLESSFKEGTEYILGLRESADHSAHGHGGEAHVPARIRSGCAFHTLGGLEASPLFAEALLDRAYEVSKAPSKETVILLAHGTESEDQNNHWLHNLSLIADHMKATAKAKGRAFRDIQYATWREDWPKLREKAAQDIRKQVEEASRDGGTAIVIPARTTRAGQEQEWLEGLDYVFNGNGFAPHPKFVAWVEEQIQRSLDHFNRRGQPQAAAAAPMENHHHH